MFSVIKLEKESFELLKKCLQIYNPSWIPVIEDPDRHQYTMKFYEQLRHIVGAEISEKGRNEDYTFNEYGKILQALGCELYTLWSVAFANLDSKSLCKEIMKRPALYVGVARLDYVLHYLRGFEHYKHFMNSHEIGGWGWNVDGELQYWLMQNQSACIRKCATLNGEILFYKCFGVRTKALKYYAKYLHTDIPKLVDDNDVQFHNRYVARDVNELRKKITAENAKDRAEIESAIMTLIEGLIAEEAGHYDTIRIYIYRAYYFAQIRFIYHTPTGWKNDQDMISRESNYEKLIKLHALVETLEDKEVARLSGRHRSFEKSAVYFHSTLDKSSEVRNDVSDEDSIYYKYQQWEDSFTCGY